MKIQTIRKIIGERLTLIPIIIISVLIGYIATLNLINAADRCKILYVSQDEIMDIENKRISNLELDKREMFFGRIQEAVKLAGEIPALYQTKDTKVIYTGGKISGKDTISISSRVHKEIIKRLAKTIEEVSYE